MSSENLTISAISQVAQIKASQVIIKTFSQKTIESYNYSAYRLAVAE